MLLRMAEVDRATYGGPEDLDFAAVPGWLDGLGYDDLVAVEDQVRDELKGAKLVPPGEEISLLWALDQYINHTRLTSRFPMIRLRLWLALRAAGVDLPFADFRPARLYGIRVLKPEAVRPDGGAVPPAEKSDSSPTSSPTPDEATAENTPTSASSTGGSTPGPGEPTE